MPGPTNSAPPAAEGSAAAAPAGEPTEREAAPAKPGGESPCPDDMVHVVGSYCPKVERECLKKLEGGCRALVISFRDTELVNSIGVSILLGVIDAAEGVGAQLVFSDVNSQTVELFEMLGLTKYVALAEDEQEALETLTQFISPAASVGH